MWNGLPEELQLTTSFILKDVFASEDFFPSFFLAWSLNSRNLQWLLGKFQEATLPQNNYFHLLTLRKVPAFQTWDFIANETNEAVCLLFSEVQMWF